jgi:hypothetical protein
MVGMVGVRAGVQLNGTDTGLFPVRPYLRGQVAGSLGPASVRGTGVVGGINSAYASAGVQTPVGGIEYTPADPVAGSDKLSMRTFAISVGMTRRGVEGGFGVPLLPLLGTASVLVQNGAAKKVSKKLRNGGFVRRFRDRSPTLDRALSDAPPPAAELVRGFRAEQAQRKQNRRARAARRKQARRARVARWKQAWRRWAGRKSATPKSAAR